MSPFAGGICLSMIVKNEAAIIKRCLDAVGPWVDRYSIHDTGSTDDTVQVIQDHMAALGIPGEVTHGEFRDFSYARNEALANARRQGCEWILLTDADMELEVTDPEWCDHLRGTAAWGVMWHSGDLAYPQIRLVRSDSPAAYVGVTHEYLEVPASGGTLQGLRFVEHSDSGSRDEKFPRDLQLLTEQVHADPTDARAVFYLAQTQRDMGLLVPAHQSYQQRATMGGWDEEVWFSVLQVAVCTELLRRDPVSDYLAAYDLRPTRVEPLVELARIFRERDQFEIAWTFASRAAEVDMPRDDRLFVDQGVYTWRRWDELAVAAFRTGRHQRALTAGVMALDGNPGDARLIENLGFYREA